MPFGPGKTPASSGTAIIEAASSSRAVCQPKPAMKACPIGANRNWPIDPAAVAIPTDQLRCSGGSSRVKPAMMMPKDAPDRPRPISTPAVRYSSTLVVA